MATDTELKQLAKVKHLAKQRYEMLGMMNTREDFNERLEQEIEYEIAKNSYFKATREFSKAIANNI